jgi:hypothetical protein
LSAISFNGGQMLFELRIVGQEFKDLIQRNNAHHRNAEITFDFLNSGQLAVSTLLAVQCDQHASSICTLGLNDLHDFANGRASRDDVINDQHIAGQRSADQTATFTMRLGLLAVETPG